MSNEAQRSSAEGGSAPPADSAAAASPAQRDLHLVTDVELDNNDDDARHGERSSIPVPADDDASTFMTDRLNAPGQEDPPRRGDDRQEEFQRLQNSGRDYFPTVIARPGDDDEHNAIRHEHVANTRGPVTNDRFAKDGLDLAIQSSPATRESVEHNSRINPEKLAYILIGVCCGLSLLCLIIVAISIGYKTETHYRLDDGRRKKHIRLLKASRCGLKSFSK